MAGAVHESGASSFKDGWGGWRTSASTRGLCAAGSAGAAGALGGGGTTGIFLGGKFDAVGLELLTGSGQVV